MEDLRFWIKPEGAIIKISDDKIDEHCDWFNVTEEGKKYSEEHGLHKVTPEVLPYILHKGFISIIMLGGIASISYAATSQYNLSPANQVARDVMLSLLGDCLCHDVIYDAFIGVKSVTKLISLEEYLNYLNARLFDNEIPKFIEEYKKYIIK